MVVVQEARIEHVGVGEAVRGRWDWKNRLILMLVRSGAQADISLQAVSVD